MPCFLYHIYYLLIITYHDNFAADLLSIERGGEKRRLSRIRVCKYHKTEILKVSAAIVNHVATTAAKSCIRDIGHTLSHRFFFWTYLSTVKLWALTENPPKT